MVAGTLTCSSLLSGASCEALIKAERVVSYWAAGIIFIMMAPIVAIFIIDFVTYAVRTMAETAQRQKAHEFRFKSTNQMRKYFQDVSTLIRESKARMRRFGLRVEDD